MLTEAAVGDDREEQLRQACAELERRLRAGEPCGAEELFQTFPAVAAHEESALELIYREFLLREQMGQPPSLEELCGRFPQWRTRLERLFRVHHLFQGSDSEPVLSGDTPFLAPESPTDGASESSADSVRRLENYELLEEVGRGGMGVVYKARQKGLNRLVALKMVLAGGHASEAELQRFRREAEAAARLQHPNIVQIHEVGEHEGRPFFSMEYVEGGSLEDKLSGTPLPPREAAQLLQTLARAVHHAHQRGVVHRDLKPANILLHEEKISRKDAKAQSSKEEQEGEGQGSAPSSLPLGALASLREISLVPKITDFGLAKQLEVSSGQTQSGAIIGTPSYMAPEQASGQSKTIGPAVDIYALGAILYECLTGRPPFQGATLLDTFEQVRVQEPVPPTSLQPKLPRDLETICLKCLRKEPHKRYASAERLAEDLRRFLQGEPIQARPVRTWERVILWVRRRPAAAALMGVSAVALAALVAVVVGLYYNADLEALNTELESAKQDTDVANNQLQGALLELQRKKAETDRGWAEAEKQRTSAREQEALARHYLYVAQINLAQRVLQQKQIGRALQLLDELRHRQPDQEDLRGFEWYYLWQLCHGDLFALRGHSGKVTGVVFSPDGKRLASGSADRTVKIWDPATGKEMASFKGHTDAITCVVFSPDGKLLASASCDKTVRVWNLQTGQEVLCLKRHTGKVTCVAFSPKGNQLASASEDKTVRVWGAQTGRTIRTLEGVGGLISTVGFTANGKCLSCAVVGKRVKVWNVETGKILLTPDIHPTVRGLAFSPDSQRLAAAAGVAGVADGSAATAALPGEFDTAVWDLQTGEEIFAYDQHNAPVDRVAFSPDGQYLASAGAMVRVWNLATRKELLALHPPSMVLAVAFSPDGQLLATGNDDHTVRVWSTARRTLPLLVKPGRINNVVYTPDGQFLAATGHKWVTIWNAETGGVTQNLESPGNDGRVTFSPNGKALAGGNGPVMVWDVTTGRVTHTLREDRLVFGVAFSPDGRLLATAGLDGKVRVWDLAEDRVLHTLPVGIEMSTSVAFSPDRRYLASANGRDADPHRGRQPGRVKVWDVASGKEAFPLGGDTYSAWSVVFSPDGKRIAAACGDLTGVGEVKVWDATTGQELFTLKGYNACVFSVAFSPDGRRLASASGPNELDFGEIKIWDLTTGRELLSIREHKDGGYGVAYSPDGKRLASAGADGKLRIWGEPSSAIAAGKHR
jgi:WD40 repeat protein/serine/threonine protein kinase